MSTITDASGTIIESVDDLGGETKAHVYAQITVTGTAATLASLCAAATPAVTIPAWATFAFVMPESGAVRYRSDGTAPTSSVGFPIPQSQAWPLQGQPTLQATQLIAESGSVTVSVEFRG